MIRGHGVITRLIFLCVLLGLAACSSTTRAPVVTRTDGQRANESPSTSQASGVHIVGKGDTLYSISWRYGLDYRDIAAWNQINKPYVIYPRQRLRLTAPAPSKTPSGKTTKKQTSTTTASKSKSTKKLKSKTRVTQNKKTSSSISLKWYWPTQGQLVRSDSPIAKKGIDIGGKLGQKISAAAAGDVVYSGSGLLGYGKLIIVKHNDVFLSAYAHNSKILVNEGDRVKQGQQIAKMGLGNTGQALLHFEIRKNGKPVNPLTYLPKHKS